MEILKFRTILNSGNQSEIILALSPHSKGAKPQYLPDILDLLNKKPDLEIQKIISQILGHLDQQESANILLNHISECNDEYLLKILLVGCWENGLDYSEHIEIFAKKALNGSFEIALEVMTVIENLPFFPQKSVLEEIIFDMEKANLHQAIDKVRIITEIIKILQGN